MGDVGISRCPQSLRYSCHGHGNGTESAIPCLVGIGAIAGVTLMAISVNVRLKHMDAERDAKVAVHRLRTRRQLALQNQTLSLLVDELVKAYEIPSQRSSQDFFR